MKYTRKPQQKRSVEKKDKIEEAAFVLFCEKGLDNTNISEIAKYAGVATGTIYSYFSDKIDLYKIVFENYLNKEVSKMLSILENEMKERTDMHQFILEWKNSYFSLFGQPNRALIEISTAMSKVPDLNIYFSEFEVEYAKSIYELLKNTYNSEITFEKVWLAFLIIDDLSKEYAYNRHKSIKYQLLEKQAITSVETILTN